MQLGGWGSAKASGSISGNTNSSREETVKNIHNAVSKNSENSSAKRDIQINTSTEVKETEGEETVIVREIENINVSRTLNFIFRQMNQEFITLISLTDIRLAFYNGESEYTEEFSLSEMDEMITKYFMGTQEEDTPEDVNLQTKVTVEKEKNDIHSYIKDTITKQITEIVDYEGNVPTKGYSRNESEIDFSEDTESITKKNGFVQTKRTW